MKRVLIILCCICLIVCLAAPALAAMTVDWKDYVVSTTPGIQYDTNDVFVPSSVTGARWRYILNGSTIETVNNTSYSFSILNSTDVFWFDLMLQSLVHIDITQIDKQDTLDFYFKVRGPDVSGIEFWGRTIYYDASGNVLLNTSTPHSTLDSLGAGVLSVDLSSAPDGAATFTTNLSYKFSGAVPGDYSIDYVGLGFEVLSPGTLTRPSQITIHPQDYIVNESSNGDTSTLYVSVPSSDLNIGWNTLRNDDFSVLSEFYGNPYNVNLPVADYGYWIGCHVFDKLDITDIVNGSTLNVKFDFDVLDLDAAIEQPILGGVRYQVRYFDSSGAMLDTVKFFTVPDADFFTDTSLDVVIDKPAGAVAMTFLCQFMDISVDREPVVFSLDIESVNFVCDIPTMVRVQQETGRTNQLLNELVNGDHGFDSSGSNFGSEADQLAGAGNQMNDAMGSGMNSLGSMTNSVAFTGTLTTLAGVMDAVFVGHEITICGVTANPFILLVSIFAIAILLPLGLKFVFRKWGSGGG